MKIEDYTAWFDDLISKVPSAYRSDGIRLPTGNFSQGGLHIHPDEAAAWISQAGMAIEAVFGQSQAPRKLWELKLASISHSNPTPHQVKQLKGVLQGAAELVRGNRLTSLVDTIRTETEGNFIDQAEDLHRKGHYIPAAVLAGAAIEVHLRRLCKTNQLPIQGNGSTDKYRQALDTSRKDGKEIITDNSSKQILSWAGFRNTAAHEPDKFNATPQDIHQMIEGIRAFIDRYH